MSGLSDKTSVADLNDPAVMVTVEAELAAESDSPEDHAAATKADASSEAAPVDGAKPTIELKAATDQRLDSVTQLNERARDDLLRAELQVKARHNRYHEFERMVQEARVNRDAMVDARDSLATWLDERRRSLSIQLLSHVDFELERISQDEEKIRNFGHGEVGNFAGAARRLRSAFVRRMWIALIFAVIVTVLVLVVALLLRQAGIVMPVVELSAWRYVALFAVVLLFGTSGSLSSYFRGFNRLKYQLDVALAWGRSALSSIDRIRADQARLGELRPQLEERLDFYGSVLQRPWTVPTMEDNPAGFQPLADGLPANLRIAEVSDSGEETWNRLRQRFTAEHFKIGLRREGADRLLAEAAKMHGLDPNRVDFEFLDRDNMQKDLRVVLMEYACSSGVLERVGRERVGLIAQAIQRGLSPLNDHRPEVSVTNANDLDGLRLGQDLLADWGQVQHSWDEFVSEILEDPSALSKLAFSQVGEAHGEQHNFTSIASGPLRVRSRSSEHVAWTEIQSETITGTEVVTRIDITDPIDVSRVALFLSETEDDTHSGSDQFTKSHL